MVLKLVISKIMHTVGRYCGLWHIFDRRVSSCV